MSKELKKIKGTKDSVCNDCYDDGFKGRPCPHIEVEELKKECSMCGSDDCNGWEAELAELLDENKPTKIRDFVRSLLAKQQDTPMGYSQWIVHGKKFGYHDYWKDMTRIALQEEFVKCIPKGMRENNLTENITPDEMAYDDGYNQCVADIKSKLNKTNELQK